MCTKIIDLFSCNTSYLIHLSSLRVRPVASSLIDVELADGLCGHLKEPFIVIVLVLGPELGIIHEPFDVCTLTVDSHHDLDDV